MLLLALLIAACGGRERELGDCRFRDPLRLVELRDQRLFTLRIARAASEPHALYIATGRSVASTAAPAEALRVDLASGAQTWTDVPFGGMSGRGDEQWVHFGTGERVSPLAPEPIRSGVLRVAFNGTKTTRKAVGPAFGDQRWRLRDVTTYTGDRVVMHGDRVLLEQTLTNFDHVPGTDRNLAVDPEGGFVAAFCQDRRANWIGIYDRSRLGSPKPSK